MRRLGLLDILQELDASGESCGLFTVEVTSIQEMPPSPPAIGPLLGVTPRISGWPSARAGEAE